jgi:hypothetical protein
MRFPDAVACSGLAGETPSASLEGYDPKFPSPEVFGSAEIQSAIYGSIVHLVHLDGRFMRVEAAGAGIRKCEEEGLHVEFGGGA